MRNITLGILAVLCLTAGSSYDATAVHKRGAQSMAGPLTLTNGNIVIPPDKKICLDGATCSKSVSSSTSFGGGWNTVLDCDFRAQATNTIGTDGVHTICGLQWAKINSANEVLPMQIVNGVGLVIKPAAATDMHATARTLPAITLPLTTVIPSIDAATNVRVWLYVVSSNDAANYDGATLAIESGANRTNFYISPMSRYGGNRTVYSSANLDGANSGYTSKEAFANKNVGVITLFGVYAYSALWEVGDWTSGNWPSASSLDQTAVRQGLATTGVSDGAAGFVGSAGQYNVLIGSHRAGSATDYQSVIGAVKIEAR